MEVMLEIYKTLQVLNMQWRRKAEIGLPDIGPRLSKSLFRPLEDDDGNPLPVEEDDGKLVYNDEVDSVLSSHTTATGEKVEMDRGKPAKKEAAALEKAASSLYLVETRARYGDVVVSAR